MIEKRNMIDKDVPVIEGIQDLGEFFSFVNISL